MRLVTALTYHLLVGEDLHLPDPGWCSGNDDHGEGAVPMVHVCVCECVCVCVCV